MHKKYRYSLPFLTLLQIPEATFSNEDILDLEYISDH